MVQSTFNKLFKSDTCLCDIHVKRGAEIFATLFLVLAAIRGIVSITFSLIQEEPAYCSWLVYHIMMIIFCVMVLTAERRDEAWFYLPLVAVTGIFGLTKIFIGAIGLISVAADLEHGKAIVFAYIPKYYLTQPERFERDDLKYDAYGRLPSIYIALITFYFS